MATPPKNTTLSRQTGYYPATPTKLGQGDRPTTTINLLEPRRLEGFYPGRQGENPTQDTVFGQNRFGGRRRKSKKGGKWSRKYKRSINCRRPKGFSQRQHCKYGRHSRRR